MGWVDRVRYSSSSCSRLVAITVIAAVAGVVAAWLPARRAARLDVLAAIASN